MCTPTFLATAKYRDQIHSFNLQCHFIKNIFLSNLGNISMSKFSFPSVIYASPQYSPLSVFVFNCVSLCLLFACVCVPITLLSLTLINLSLFCSLVLLTHLAFFIVFLFQLFKRFLLKAFSCSTIV